jgi:hypothetical protein
LLIQGYEIAFRPLTVRDALRAGKARDVYQARLALLEAAVIGARHGGESVDPRDLPDTVAEALGEAIRERDPQSDVRVAMQCPSCEHQWSIAFDIVSFLYKELAVLAARFLNEIHLLARAYGWSESSILAMSPARRRAYLEFAT